MGVGGVAAGWGGIDEGGVAAKVLLFFKRIDLCFGSSVVLILSSIGISGYFLKNSSGLDQI